MSPDRIALGEHRSVVFFTGAGMSAESGVPTYRGRGGIWSRYRWEDYACQRAFDRAPDQVLDFHEARRSLVRQCQPHAGHRQLAQWQAQHADLSIVTQNIDGMHQRAGATRVTELHGSLWRVRCDAHGVHEDWSDGPYRFRKCPRCRKTLRPDITWFEDPLDSGVWDEASAAIQRCSLFVSVGTSGAVWPAAGLAELAIRAGAVAVEINLEDNEASSLYRYRIRQSASIALSESHFAM